MRRYAIGLENLSDPARRSTLAAAITSFYAHKIGIFEEAGEFDPGRQVDLATMQRALESGKSYARKAIAASALEGFAIIDADVTSKASMKEQTEILLERIDTSGRMRRVTDAVNELDEEYSEVLDEAVESGDVDEYSGWLKRSYLPACAGALALSRFYYNYVDRVTWADPTIVYDEFMNPEDDFAMQDSSSEEVDTEGGGDPILINLAPEEVFELAVAYTT